MAKIFVQIHDPAGERAVSYDGMDLATVTDLVTQMGFSFDIITQATYDAFIASHQPPIPTAADLVATRRAQAASELTTSTQGLTVLQKAILMTLIDEINTIRAALVPPLLPRTGAQFKNAVQNKITGGQGD